MRILFIGLLALAAACTPEQSKNIGAQPKKTVDSVAAKAGNAMQQGQGAERLKEGEQK
jgi:hypothetical protein